MQGVEVMQGDVVIYDEAAIQGFPVMKRSCRVIRSYMVMRSCRVFGSCRVMQSYTGCCRHAS